MLPYRIRTRAERTMLLVVLSIITSYTGALALGVTRFMV